MNLHYDKGDTIKKSPFLEGTCRTVCRICRKRMTNFGISFPETSKFVLIISRGIHINSHFPPRSKKIPAKKDNYQTL